MGSKDCENVSLVRPHKIRANFLLLLLLLWAFFFSFFSFLFLWQTKKKLHLQAAAKVAPRKRLTSLLKLALVLWGGIYEGREFLNWAVDGWNDLAWMTRFDLGVSTAKVMGSHRPLHPRVMDMYVWHQLASEVSL